jgi:hypothetical protein
MYGDSRSIDLGAGEDIDLGNSENTEPDSCGGGGGGG